MFEKLPWKVITRLYRCPLECTPILFMIEIVITFASSLKLMRIVGQHYGVLDDVVTKLEEGMSVSLYSSVV